MSVGLNLCIDGAIGVGKSTLAAALCRRLGAEGLFEADIGNPFLAEFYRHPDRWALTCQIAFLEGRIRQFTRPVDDGLPRIADHCLAKDRLFAGITLDGDEWALYDRLFQRLAPLCRFHPRVVVYLKARLETLVERIRQRRRKEDAAIPIDYLDQLIAVYDAHYLERAPEDHAVIVVDLDAADIAADAEATDDLLRVCRRAPIGLSYYNPLT